MLRSAARSLTDSPVSIRAQARWRNLLEEKNGMSTSWWDTANFSKKVVTFGVKVNFGLLRVEPRQGEETQPNVGSSGQARSWVRSHPCG